MRKWVNINDSYSKSASNSNGFYFVCGIAGYSVKIS